MILVTILIALHLGPRAAWAGDEFCETDLSAVDPMAADPYERLGVPEGIPSTRLTTRFRAAVAAYRHHPGDLSRLASAYAQVRLDYASGAQFDDSSLPVAALRRAHGRIYGDPLGGRFTVGYSLNREGMPEMDYSLMMRATLGATAAERKLRALPVEVRPAFEELLKYFGKQIRRVGLEGAFEDTVGAGWTRAREIPREKARPAMKLFVDLFGRVYREAQADPGGDEEIEARRSLQGLKFPPRIERSSLDAQLAAEDDPRTFLRKVVAFLRQPRAAAREAALERFAGVYAARFLVEPAQFLQHLLLFATDQWTTRRWDLALARDRRAVGHVLGLLRALWIERPAARGEPPRIFDYASVLHDALRPLGAEPFAKAQPNVPPWAELTRLLAAHPDVRVQFETERQGRSIPSDILPW